MSYQRGILADGFAARAHTAFLASDSGAPSEAERIVRAYYDYHVSALLRDYLLAGSTSLADLSTLLQSVVRAAFSVALASDKQEITDAREIDVQTEMSFDRRSAQTRVALGYPRQGELGETLVLGDRAAEDASTVLITIKLRSHQLENLASQPKVYGYLVEAFEECVPLTADFSVRFVVTEQDRTFCLATGEGLDVPRLGLTTGLGAGGGELSDG